MIDVNELPDLYPQVDEEADDVIRGAWCYGHRHAWGPQGDWVVTLPTDKSNRIEYEARGFRYMEDEYGKFKPNPGDGKPVALDAQGHAWQSYTEPWRLLFQRDGAKEFPLSQIIAFHWHIRPPYRQADFPQLKRFYADGGEIFDYQCPECQRVVIFSSVNDREAIRQLRTHLTSAINEQHKYSPTDLKTLGDELGIDFTVKRVGRVRVPPAVAEQPVVEPVLELSVQDEDEVLNLAYRCDECGWAPLKTNKNPINALRFHKKARHSG